MVFVMRLIYNSRLRMYFLNLLLFTQPSAVNVTAAICVIYLRQLHPKSEFVTEE